MKSLIINHYDISNHIKNLYFQIPFHFKQKKQLEAIINTPLKDTDARN